MKAKIMMFLFTTGLIIYAIGMWLYQNVATTALVWNLQCAPCAGLLFLAAGVIWIIFKLR